MNRPKVKKVKWILDCPRCGGKGYIVESENFNCEFTDTAINCRGSTTMKKCPSCNGQGSISEPLEWWEQPPFGRFKGRQ